MHTNTDPIDHSSQRRVYESIDGSNIIVYVSLVAVLDAGYVYVLIT